MSKVLVSWNCNRTPALERNEQAHVAIFDELNVDTLSAQIVKNTHASLQTLSERCNGRQLCQDEFRRERKPTARRSVGVAFDRISTQRRIAKSVTAQANDQLVVETTTTKTGAEIIQSAAPRQIVERVSDAHAANKVSNFVEQ